MALNDIILNRRQAIIAGANALAERFGFLTLSTDTANDEHRTVGAVRTLLDRTVDALIFLTSGLKVVLGMLLAVLLSGPIIARGYLRSVTFFPVLISSVGVGLTFQVLRDPFNGIVNKLISSIYKPKAA